MDIVEGSTEECVATASCSTTTTATRTATTTTTTTTTAPLTSLVHAQQDDDDDDTTTASANTNTNSNPNAKSTTVEGVELPAMREVDGVHLYRNGHGMRFIPFFGMNIKIYVAAMYSAKPILSAAQAMREKLLQQYRSTSTSSEAGSSSAIDASLSTTTTTAAINHRDDDPHHGPLQLDFTFLRYVGQSRVVSAWTQQLDHSVTFRDYEGYEADRHRFIRLASGGPIANQGTQSVQLVGNETRIIDQGIFQGVVHGENFQRSFLSIWFGSMAVCQDLKSNLLRGDEHHPTAVWEVRQQLQQHEQMLTKHAPIIAA